MASDESTKKPKLSEWQSSIIQRIRNEGMQLISNPGADLLLATIVLALERRWRGIIVTAFTTFGKTLGFEWAMLQLPKLLGTVVPWLAVETPDKKVFKSPTAFLDMMVAEAKIEAPSRNSVKRMDQLAKHFTNLAARSKTRSFILEIDEAQEMKLDDYELLKLIGNLMKKRKTLLLVVLIGQPGLATLRSQLLEAKPIDADQLYERFAKRVIRFPGIRSEKELLAFITQFEAQIEVNGKSVVASFIPIAFDAGFSLATIVPRLWERICAQSSASQQATGVEIGIGHVVEIIAFLLSDMALIDKVDLQISSEMLDLCIRNSEYPSSIINQ